MLTATRQRAARVGAGASDAVGRTARDPVLVVGIAMVLGQTVFRAWALYGSWFYADDFAMVGQARRPLTLDYLMEPYSIHVLPLGRLEAWVVERSGGLNWGMAASITLAFSLLCGLACLWMLVTLFGRRWGVLAPLAIYLTSAISISGTMWWAASLNQLPHQLAIMLAVGAWVRYLRTDSRGWLVAAATAVLFGLAAYVKSALILPLLAYLLLAYFVTGSPWARARDAVRRYWRAAALFAVVGVAFVVQYLSSVPDATAADGESDPVGLAGTMLGQALATGVLGGPWRWSSLNHPAAFAEPPDAAVVACWIVLVLGVLFLALTRLRTGRAWILLVGYAVGSYVLLLGSRAPGIGPVIGLEYRYLADLAVISTLCLGLATMRLIGAPESSAARQETLISFAPRRAHLVGATALIAVLGTVSTTSYVRVWHDDNPGQTFLDNATTALDRQPLDLVDAALPAAAVPPVVGSYNQLGTLLPMLTDNADFPSWSRRLAVLDDLGVPRAAAIDTAAAGQSTGEGCGWQLFGSDVAAVELTADLFEWTWWVRIGYLASSGGQVEITGGESSVVAEVEPGANSLYVSLPGEYSSVELRGLTEGVNVCVDVVEVGLPVPGGPL